MGMRNVGPALAVVVSALFIYAITGDLTLPGIVLLMAGLLYVISIKPALGGPLPYGLIGFLAGFVLAIVLGVTVFRDSKIGSNALISLLVIGPMIAILLGRRSSYRLWLLLRP
ncbi:hypothetical protein [Thermococcus gammatolerans]|uniref:Uncharacterized protein n=1 Tax=Thermococcus gammatolerans (strain DSM 15229 / JCM 11827 / EJ3) TaxID=593117 RepID=C5A1L1_THEGJ|nr:hypothetical protein [Thermococcus gammatolerans]ACS34280.1 Hypothetical protein TGAM_1778 [Thermococcus gammatolerans EJ3]